MKTSNPVLGAKTFSGLARSGEERMTIMGTVHKSFILLALLMFSAIWSWNYFYQAAQNNLATPFWFFPSLFISFGLAIVISFKKEWSPFLSPAYALGEGMILGYVSGIYEFQYQGIVLQAALGTMSTLAALLLAYRSGLIKVTEKFKLGVVAATGGIALVYFVAMIMSFFGKSMPFLYDSSPLGIGISLVVVVVASLNLVLDFDFIEQGSKIGAPKYMEWYGAFGLLVTLVWLYLEILRLLSKLQRRR